MENNEQKVSKAYDIRQKSDFVNDILEKTPSWIISWGNTIFLLFIILLIVLAAFIRYPDTIIADTIIDTERPTVSIISEVSSELEKKYRNNKDFVEKGDVILKMYTRAYLKDVLFLEEEIRKFQKKSDTLINYSIYNFPEGLKLGKLTDSYNLFVKDFKNFKQFINQDFTFKKINSLKKEVSKILQLNRSLQKQQNLYQKQFDLTLKNYQRNVQLNKKGVISDLDRENIEATYLIEKRQLENFQSTKINNEVKIEQLNTQINEILSNRSEELSLKLNNINEKLHVIEDKIQSWKDVFLIKAPISGTLSFSNDITEQKYISEGETLFEIIPSGKNEIIGIAEMPLANSGNISIGDQVQLRIDAFSYQEYGILESTVSDIALIAKRGSANSFLEVKLKLPKSLETIFGKKIPFTPKMTAKGLIIKDDKSLLKRFFDQIKIVFTN